MKWLGLGALGMVGVIVLAVVTLWLAGMRADAGRVQASVDIARSPAEVWLWITEPEKEKAWVGSLVEVKQEGPVQTGSRQIWSLQDLKKGGRGVEILSVTTAAEPGQRLAVQLSATGTFTGSATYLLTDLGGGKTRLSCDSHYQYASAFVRLLEPLITPSAVKKFKMDLTRLKMLAEAAPSTAATAVAQ